MIKTSMRKTLPPRNGGQVTVIAEGRVNPGEVSRDGKTVVYGEFKPGTGEMVHRWRDGESLHLNTDGYSSYQARTNEDGSVVTYHRYSLKDATDKSGNWDIARWEDGKTQVVANSELDETSPDIDDSGAHIVYDVENPDGSSHIRQWETGVTTQITEGEVADLFAELSGNGERILWRRDRDVMHLRDQNGVVKGLPHLSDSASGVMLDETGSKVLYTTKDEDGDQDVFLTDLNNNTTIAIANLKGVDEYNGYISGDGKTVVYTGIDRRKEKSDMNIYIWQDGKTEQLTWDDGGMNTMASVSRDGKAVSWLWIDHDDTKNRKVLLWEKDQA